MPGISPPNPTCQSRAHKVLSHGFNIHGTFGLVQNGILNLFAVSPEFRDYLFMWILAARRKKVIVML